jgi:hypothetical protein
MSTGFFNLPPELRLEVYTHLVKGSIACGDIASIAGLFFSCREIYDEMKSARISKVRHILTAMRKWAAKQPETWAEHMRITPLKIELPQDYEFTQPPTSAIISIPFMPYWRMCGLDPASDKTFVDAVEGLHPLLCRPWTTLQLRIYFPPSVVPEPTVKQVELFEEMPLVQTMYLALLYVMYEYPKYPGGEVRIGEPFKNTQILVLRYQDYVSGDFVEGKDMTELVEKDLRKFRKLDAHHRCEVDYSNEQLGEGTGLHAVFQLGKWGPKK